MIVMQALQGLGIDARDLLLEAGIDPDEQSTATRRVPFESVEKLFRLIVERTGNPAIGIELAEYTNPMVYSSLGIALLCSSTLRRFFHRWERFFEVVSTLESARFEETEYGGYMAELPNVDYSEETRGVHADAFCAEVVKFVRLIYRPDYSPRRVDLNWEPPAECHLRYREYFGCEIQFGKSLTAVHFDIADLDVPLPSSNASLAFQNDQLARVMQSDVKKDDIQARVYARLIEFLPEGECSRARVARSLYLSESSFQKKLKAVGTSYQELLDRTRTELARHYLGTEGLSISEAAFMLGFTDSSNFSRAFKRWVGVSPSKYRIEHSEVSD